MGPDFAYAISGGVTRVNRFFPFSLDEELQSSELSQEALLRMCRPGRLDSMHWTAHPATDPRGDEVEIVVYAAGLNYRVSLLITKKLSINMSILMNDTN